MGKLFFLFKSKTNDLFPILSIFEKWFYHLIDFLIKVIVFLCFCLFLTRHFDNKTLLNSYKKNGNRHLRFSQIIRKSNCDTDKISISLLNSFEKQFIMYLKKRICQAEILPITIFFLKRFDQFNL